MFPDSGIAKKLPCRHTKVAVVIKEALAPHYIEKHLVMSKIFSVIMDESNDKTNKYCIIIVRTFDTELQKETFTLAFLTCECELCGNSLDFNKYPLCPTQQML